MVGMNVDIADGPLTVGRWVCAVDGEGVGRSIGAFVDSLAVGFMVGILTMVLDGEFVPTMIFGFTMRGTKRLQI
jgi:hypothetical protein